MSTLWTNLSPVKENPNSNFDIKKNDQHFGCIYVINSPLSTPSPALYVNKTKTLLSGFSQYIKLTQIFPEWSIVLCFFFGAPAIISLEVLLGVS